MAGESWDEARLLIMDKLATHTNEIASVKLEQQRFNEKLRDALETVKINMNEMSVKLRIQGGAALFIVNTALLIAGWYLGK